MSPPLDWHRGERQNLDPQWLARRQQLFETYCLPSLDAQQGVTLTVLVYFAADTPLAVQRAVCSRPFLTAVLTDPEVRSGGAMLAEVVRGIREVVGAMRADGRLQDGDVVATTRLDSDDALGPGYLEEVNRAYVAAGRPEVLYAYFPRGQCYVEALREYRLFNHPKNAFGTLFERVTDPAAMLTVMHLKHVDLLAAHADHAVAVAPERPGWCHVVHDVNVSNRPMGEVVTEGYFPVGPTAAA